MNDDMIDLPDLPSELLRVGLDDLILCMKDPTYDIDMGIWHRPFSDEDYPEVTCTVCVAGAVMAQSLNIPIDQNMEPLHFGRNARKLHALDELRLGLVESAARTLRIKIPVEDRSIRYYMNGPIHFIADMEILIKNLKDAGS